MSFSLFLDQIDRNFGLKTVIQNKHNENVSIVFFDTIPWYFRTYVNSLVIREENENRIISPDSIHFVPGLDRSRPHHIEIKLNLKPKTTYSIYIRQECAHLKWDEYPPDVNHGFYINPALISVTLTKSLEQLFSSRIPNEFLDKTRTQFRIYSETLLMNLPTPDFSMPYNVICLTCTVIAIGFGSLHNFTTRKFKFYPSKSPKDKVMEILGKFLKKKSN
jgi:phosphatidylinositol glycan class T